MFFRIFNKYYYSLLLLFHSCKMWNSFNWSGIINYRSQSACKRFVRENAYSKWRWL